MDILKKIFPFSFAKKEGVAGLIINVLIQLVVAIVAGVIIGLVAKIPVVGVIVGLVGGLVDLYFVAGIVLSFLHYFNVLKD